VTLVTPPSDDHVLPSIGTEVLPGRLLTVAAHHHLALGLSHIEDPVHLMDVSAIGSSLTHELRPESLDLSQPPTRNQSLEELLLVAPLAEHDPLFRRRKASHHQPAPVTARRLLEKVPVQVPTAVTGLVVLGHHLVALQLCAVPQLAQLLQIDLMGRRHPQFL
jgi:hypothetical protein